MEALAMGYMRLALTLYASRYLARYLHEWAHLVAAVLVGRGKGALTARNVLFGGIRGIVHVPYASTAHLSHEDGIIRNSGWLFSVFLAACSALVRDEDVRTAMMCGASADSLCDLRLVRNTLTVLQVALWWTALDACA